LLDDSDEEQNSNPNINGAQPQPIKHNGTNLEDKMIKLRELYLDRKAQNEEWYQK
jgi:hypothetical protein